MPANATEAGNAVHESLEDAMPVDLSSLLKDKGKVWSVDYETLAEQWGIQSKESSEDKKLERSVRDKVRKILFGELGINSESLQTSVQDMVQKRVDAMIKKLEESGELRTWIKKQVEGLVHHKLENMQPKLFMTLNNQVAVNHRSMIDKITEEVSKEVQKQVTELAANFVRDNLSVRFNQKAEPTSGRKLITS